LELKNPQKESATNSPQKNQISEHALHTALTHLAKCSQQSTISNKLQLSLLLEERKQRAATAVCLANKSTKNYNTSLHQ
jgi:hypothetical protein